MENGARAIHGTLVIKQPKTAVDNGRGHAGSYCGKSFPDDKGYCRHYRPRTETEGTCELVAGTINRVYWCKLFARAVKA
jgi:hypothetical protein